MTKWAWTGIVLASVGWIGVGMAAAGNDDAAPDVPAVVVTPSVPTHMVPRGVYVVTCDGATPCVLSSGVGAVCVMPETCLPICTIRQTYTIVPHTYLRLTCYPGYTLPQLVGGALPVAVCPRPVGNAYSPDYPDTLSGCQTVPGAHLLRWWTA